MVLDTLSISSIRDSTRDDEEPSRLPFRDAVDLLRRNACSYCSYGMPDDSATRNLVQNQKL